MGEKLQKNIVLYIAVFLAIFTILPILAPIFAHLGFSSAADGIYSVYQWFCHQRPWRSYHMFDYQYALDARMTFIFLSMSIGAFSVHFKKIKPLAFDSIFALALFLIIPLGVDGIVQMIAEMRSIKEAGVPFYESTNLIRSLTGILFGTGIAFFMLPFLNFQQNDDSKISEIYKDLLFTVLISAIFIPVIVFLWQITSTNYLPSSLFIDSKRRIPGYNYEITEGAGHSTIERKHKTREIEFFTKRAEKYERFDLIDKYNER